MIQAAASHPEIRLLPPPVKDRPLKANGGAGFGLERLPESDEDLLTISLDPSYEAHLIR